MNIYIVLIIAVWCRTSSASNSIAKVHHTGYHESILCRSCGHDIASTKHLIAKASPKSQYSFYDTVFNRQQDVFVQVLTDLFIFYYPVVTLSESTCSGAGQWEESSWFPGYRSRPCVCPECGTYVGWEYQPISHIRLDDPQSFFGFILLNIIGENFADSLIEHPKEPN